LHDLDVVLLEPAVDFNLLRNYLDEIGNFPQPLVMHESVVPIPKVWEVKNDLKVHSLLLLRNDLIDLPDFFFSLPNNCLLKVHLVLAGDDPWRFARLHKVHIHVALFFPVKSFQLLDFPSIH
jgi:hypothetical protein